MNWSIQQILTLTNDTGTHKNGLELSKGAKLSGMGKSSGFIWGECKGSGKTSYQIIIDLSDGAAKCNCPSPKFPCKHSLGLFLHFAANAAAFPDMPPTAWAEKWMEYRLQKDKKSKEVKPKSDKTLQKEAEKKQKEAALKLENIQKIVDNLIDWCHNNIRSGLSLLDNMYSFGNDQRAWLANAKADGELSRMIFDLDQIKSDPNDPDWIHRFLFKFGNFYLFLRTYKNIENFDVRLQDELKGLMGVATKKENIQQEYTPFTDDWVIVGNAFETRLDREGLDETRWWFYGVKHQQFSLIHEYKHRNQTEKSRAYGSLGMSLQGDMYFYPAMQPIRGFLSSYSPTHSIYPNIFLSIHDNLSLYAQYISQNPWQRHFLFRLKEMRLLLEGKTYFLINAENEGIPIHYPSDKIFTLLALTQNTPFDITGEWNGKYLVPCGVWVNQLPIHF